MLAVIRVTYRRSVGYTEQSEDPKATQHFENVQTTFVLQTCDSQNKADPIGEDRYEIHSVEPMAQKRSSS